MIIHYMRHGFIEKPEILRRHPVQMFLEGFLSTICKNRTKTGTYMLYMMKKSLSKAIKGNIPNLLKLSDKEL